MANNQQKKKTTLQRVKERLATVERRATILENDLYNYYRLTKIRGWRIRRLLERHSRFASAAWWYFISGTAAIVVAIFISGASR